MAGEQLPFETVASPAESVPATFRTHVRDLTRPLLRAFWYSPAHWRFIGFVRDHVADVVEFGGITSAAMRTSLIEELGYQFSEPVDIREALVEYDLRDTDGRRPLIGVLGRFLLLGRFHYMDAQIMPRPLQMLFAPDKLAHAMSRSLMREVYDHLQGEYRSTFEVYDGRISRFRALRLGLPQAALLGNPHVFAMRQATSPVTLVWAGDETRPNLAEFSRHNSTGFIRKLVPRESRGSNGRRAA